MKYVVYKYLRVSNPCFFFMSVVDKKRDYKLKIKIIMWWEKKKSPITQEINNFKISRQKFVSTAVQVEYLHNFVKVTGIQEADDITEVDIRAYTESLRAVSSSEFRKLQAMQALQLFMEYRRLLHKKSKISRPRGRPAKVFRNDDILAMRQQEYTYDAIAREFKLNKRTVYDIVKRLENKAENMVMRGYPQI